MGVHLIFDDNFSGRLFQNTEKKVAILYINITDFIFFVFYAKNGIICFINVELWYQLLLTFWQGSPSLKQWIKQPSSEPLVLRFKPHDLNELEKEGGVYKIIWEKKGAFSRGRAFIQSNTVEELLFYSWNI